MVDFETAVAVVLSNEGGLTDDPNDPGGLTNFGISQKQYPDVDIKNLTQTSAKIIYYRDYWQRYGLNQLLSQEVANKILDLVVNIGPVPAIRLLQQAIGYFLAGPLVADGKLGPQTASLASEVPDEKLLPELRARACAYHASLNQPSFILGWCRRDVQ
jgi:lysozyme family protein